MSHARTQIRNAFVSALAAVPGATVYNSRVFPVYDTALPAITVYSRDESIDIENGRKQQLQHRTLALSVACYAKADIDLDNSLDDLSSHVEQIVFNDPTIKGMVRCLDLAESTIEVTADGEKQLGFITLTFSLKFLTEDGQPDVILP